MDIYEFRKRYGTKGLGLMIERMLEVMPEVHVVLDMEISVLATEIGKVLGDLEHALANLPEQPKMSYRRIEEQD